MTGSVSYDRAFSLKNNDKIGIGAKFLVDQAGTFKLRLLNPALFVSYRKKILQNEKSTHYLIGGIETGWGHRSIDFSNLEDIIAPEDNSEFESEEVDYFDLNFGIDYRIAFAKNKNIDLGFAAFHVNKPNNSVSKSSSSRLPVRYVFHAQADIPVSDKLDIRPRILYAVQSVLDFPIANLGFRYSFDESLTKTIELAAGSKIRGSSGVDAYILSTTIFYKKIGISFLAEWNDSELRGEGLDSFEAGIIYRFCN